MKMRIISLVSLLLIIVMAGTLLAACGTSSTPAASGGATDGASLLQSRCTVCHSLERVTSRTGTAQEWKMLVDRMIGNGAQLNAQEETTLVNYLAQTYK
jgi:hypothetical protein